jgi:hypothetical protein
MTDPQQFKTLDEMWAWMAAELARVEPADEIRVVPLFPVGTPEYAEYAEKLRAELRLFTAGLPPYDYPDTALAAACYCGNTASVVNGECHACAIDMERGAKWRGEY